MGAALRWSFPLRRPEILKRMTDEPVREETACPPTPAVAGSSVGAMEETASARTTVAASSGVGVLEGRAWAPTAAAAGSGVGVLAGIDFPLDPVSR
jgi:hypothetical protein